MLETKSRWFPMLGIFGRLLLPMMLIVCLCLAIMLGFFVRQQKRALFQNINTEGHTLADALAPFLADSLLRDDFEGLIEHSRATLVRAPRIRRIVIEPAEGPTMIVSSDAFEIAPDTPLSAVPVDGDQSDGCGVHAIAGEATTKGLTMAHFRMDMSLADYKQKVSRLHGWNVGVMAACLALGFVGSGVVTRRIVRPIQSLAATMRRAAQGDYSARAEVVGNDEISELGQVFNGMLDELTSTTRAMEKNAYDLGERVKELQCLFALSKLLEDVKLSIEDALQSTVETLPPAWRCPELTRARIRFGAREFFSADFREGPWGLLSPILVHGSEVGTVEVFLIEECAPWGDGPFLQEERSLIDAVTERLGHFIEGKWNQETLRRNEVRLRESEERHRAIAESATDAIVTADLEGNIRYWNPAATRIFGYAAEEMIGSNFVETILAPEYREEKRRRMAELRLTIGTANQNSPREMEAVRKDGTHLPIEISLSGYRESSAVIAVALIRDISERKEAERRLFEINRELQQTSRQAGMSEVASSVLHNVGNVLNSVNVSAALTVDRVRHSRIGNLSAATNLMIEHEHDLPEFLSGDERGRRLPSYLRKLAGCLQEEHSAILAELDSLVSNIEHVKHVVQMQQSYARMSGVDEEIRLHELIENALQLNANSFERHGIRVIRDYVELPAIRAEKHKILQILVNLLSNARHALCHGEDEDMRLHVRLRPAEDGRVRIEIEDNGVGMDANTLASIFSFGFTTKKNGHGFGLHHSALLARELGGSLTASSSGPRQGASFVLELPIQPAKGAR